MCDIQGHSSGSHVKSFPNVVNERAHDAMDVLEQLLGNRRIMTKKENIPAKYLAKMKPRRVNTQSIEQK